MVALLHPGWAASPHRRSPSSPLTRGRQPPGPLVTMAETLDDRLRVRRGLAARGRASDAAGSLATTATAVVLAVLPEVALAQAAVVPALGTRRADGGRAIYAPATTKTTAYVAGRMLHVVELRSTGRETGRSDPMNAVAFRGGCLWVARHCRDLQRTFPWYRPHPGPRRTAARIMDRVHLVPAAGGGLTLAPSWRTAAGSVTMGRAAGSSDRRRDLEIVGRPAAAVDRSARHPMGDARAGPQGSELFRSDRQQQDRTTGPALVEPVVLGRCAHPACRLGAPSIDIAATSSRIIADRDLICGATRRILASSFRFLGPDLGRGACSRGTPV